MKFADFINIDSIQADLGANDKPAAIRELVESLARTGSLAESEVPGIVAAIMKREELGSTGIGRGVAVPHTKHASVERLVGTVGISVEGVDFNSLDGDKVHLLFLLVSPPDRPGDHLRALENISRQLRDDNFCRFLKQARSTKDVQLLLDEADTNQFSS
jgi:PTS system fructose-specific IIA component/PTS system nitrogen regulatory IIA component